MGWQSGTAPQARRRATTRNGAPSMAVAVPGRAQEFERSVGSVTDISPPSSLWSDLKRSPHLLAPNPRCSRSRLKNYSGIGFQGQSALGKLAFDDTRSGGSFLDNFDYLKQRFLHTLGNTGGVVSRGAL